MSTFTFNISEEMACAGRDRFAKSGLLVFRRFLPEISLQALREVAFDLFEEGMRKDFLMPQSNHTPRNMTVVGGAVMNRQDDIMGFYRDPELRRLLSNFTGADVVDCPEVVENVILTSLHEVGDTHGWHLDDYPFALIICLEAPEEGAGGDLEMEVGQSEIDFLRLEAGDAYLLRSDQIRHRVAPLSRNSRRVIMNFTYSCHGHSIIPNGSAYSLCE